ncbi:tetratricopeptide repeat protein [Pseudoflavitalea rhizosphaerae]|uniref:tetratricopeptide repeat protein n=1 Tax=Pseudoflavitalea rhizosphaerae TaxID=1884793 RepID=UPI000F8F3607|nr:tetratricopeptide repeat protein [Pseudoflavitalea rhizosphaerae]
MKFIAMMALALLTGSAFAQENMSEKELEELIRRAEKMAEKAKSGPGMKKAMEEEVKAENKPKKFPTRDNAALAALPAKPMSNGNMSSYLQNLYTAYKTKMPVGAIQAAQKATEALGEDADKMGVAGVSAWYNGAPEQGILLLLQAGAKKPEDPLLLNNLGALLNAGGAARHALPVLHTLVSRFPENPMLLNNLGQAYAGVGQLDTAMKYFARVFRKSPQHPEARNTAGQIEKQRGRTTEAIKHFQESLKGAHNLEAIQGLEECTGGNYYTKLPPVGSPIDLPYFNEFKYKLPKQCTGPADAPYIKQEHDDFRRFVSNLSAAYNNLAAAERKKGEELLDKESEKLNRTVLNALRTGTTLSAPPSIGSPVNIAAARKMMDIGMRLATVDLPDHGRRMDKLDSVYHRLIREYKGKSEKIAEEYAQKKSQYDCGEGRGADCAAIERLSKEECQKQVALGNAAQGAISAAKVDYQKEHLRFIRWQFNYSAFYGYLSGFNDHLARAAFYDACSKYLTELKRLAYDPFVCAGGRCDDERTEVQSKDESDGTKEMECPIDIDIKFIIGKIKLNCEKFEFTAGEGLVFTATKSFVGSKQTTMSLGAGLQFQGSKEWGIFSGEASGSATQSFYIVWDKDDKIIDAGIAVKAEGSIKGEAKVELPGGIGKDQLPQKEIKVEGEFGYTLGVNSGWTFADGSLSRIANAVGLFK